MRFNSRSREGSDGFAVSNYVYDVVFQFTLPRGERLYSLDIAHSLEWFQFTLPRGERLALYVR